MKNQLTRKAGFEGTQKIGPVLEVTTSYLQGKYGVEMRIESVNKDNSHCGQVGARRDRQRVRQQRVGNL